MANARTAGAAVAPLDDPARLEEMRRLGTGRAGDRHVFDRLTRLVTSLLDVPVSLISVVEPERQLLAGCVGLGEPWASARETPLSHSFCQHAVLSGDPLVIDDARAHPLVRDNLAIRDLDVVAYLGVPLVTTRGHGIGTFGAIDSQPRAWSDGDVRVLRDLAATVIAYLEGRPADAAAPRAGGLNIAAVARRTGVAADTLRKWERRYGVLRPSRTGGGQRRYDAADVARVQWLRDRVSEGFRIGEAAALLDPARGAVDSAEELREALVSTAREADSRRLVALVEQAFTLYPLTTAVDDVVAPALAELGGGWRERTAAIAEEHLLTEALRGRLKRMLAAGQASVRGKAVLACAPGERHDLGLLALAAALQADGWLVSYVGADAPLEATTEVARRVGADLVCLSVTLPESYERLASALAESGAPAGARTVVGGAGVAPGTPLEPPLESLAGERLHGVVAALRER